MSNINNKAKNMFNSTQNNTIKVLCALYELDINDVSKRYVCYIKSYSNDNNRTEDNAFNEFVKKELKKIEVFEKKDNANKREAKKLVDKKAKEEAKAILKAKKLADKNAKEEAKAILKAQKLADKEAKKLADKKAKEEAKANKVVNKIKKNKISDKKLKKIFSKAIKHTAKIAKQNIAKKMMLQKKEKALKALYIKNVKAAVKIGAKKLKQQLKEEKLAAKKANNAKKAIQAKKALKDDALKLLGNELKKEYSINVPESNNVVAIAEQPNVAIAEKPVFYKPKVVLPYCGKVNELACRAVRKNGGLYSQCQNKPAKNGVLCTTCEKNRNKREDKNPELGYITERGTKFVAKRFSEILKKKNIDKALAIEEAAKLGWVIPEHEFEIIKRVAGRPKKNKVVEVKEKKKRGRPLKNKNVEIVKGDADLKQIIDNIKDDDIINVEEYVEVLVEEEIEVINFMFNDTEYLKDTENIIYDINTQAEIGVYKKDLKHIEFY